MQCRNLYNTRIHESPDLCKVKSVKIQTHQMQNVSVMVKWISEHRFDI